MPQKNPKNSFKYIVFEGIDGSGKSTQLNLFANYLKSKGLPVFATKEPGGVIDDFRELLLNKKWPKKTELFLFLADRSVTANVVREKLEECVVLSDRSMYSTLAYQGYGEGLDIDYLMRLNLFSTDGLKPDVVFCFDIDVETMKKRLTRFDTIESKSDEFFERVRLGYTELSKKIGNFFIIDGRKAKDDVFKEVLEIWESL